MSKLKHKIDTVEKIKKISQSMYKFNDLIENTTRELDFNLNKIEQICDIHNDFINFIKTMKLFENYRWTKLKSEYMYIKKKINKDKKTINIITKFFGSLTNYYTQNEIDDITLKIKNISNKIELMIYNFSKLQIQHTEIINKIKNILHNNSILKINDINDSNKHLLQKLYENYISIKLLNIKFQNLKRIRKHLIHEINSIKSRKSNINSIIKN